MTPPKPILNKNKLFELMGYDPGSHKEVKRFHSSQKRIKVACAPRRTGKSWNAAHDVLPDILIPDSRGWIVGPSYDLAEKEFRYIHQKLVHERDKLKLPKPKTCYTNPRTGQLLIKWPPPWNAIVEGKSAGRPESLLGEAVDWVIYSEAAMLPRMIRERYVEPTLVTKGGREIIPTTPSAAAEWVYELYMKGMEEDHPDIDSFHWDVTANPFYPIEEFERAKRFYGTSDPVFREQYMGEWVFYGGVVYPSFQPDLHVIEPFDIPASWPRLRAIDFGHRDPFVCLWGAVGPESEIYIYREYYCREGKSIKEHSLFIKEHTKDEKIMTTVGDPESAQSIEDLCYERIPTISANNDRAAGRQRVLEYLLPTPDGPKPFPQKGTLSVREKHPRIYILDNCTELQREIKFYRWKEGRQVEGEKEKTEGEDHAMDTLRYLLMERPSPFRMQRRFSAKSFMGILNSMRTKKDEGAYIGG